MENEIKKNNFIEKIKKIRLKRSFVALFFAIVAFFTVQIFYLFLLFIILSIIFSILGFFDKNKASIIVSIISIVFVIFTVLYYYLYYKPNYIDPNVSKNVLVGTWQYNLEGGTYVFNKDNSYIQYMTNNNDDNYCEGYYSYEYGYETTDGIITKDPDIIYYHLVLNTKTCVITGIEKSYDGEDYKKDMVFLYRTNNPSKSMLTNTKSQTTFNLTKIK